MNWLNKVHFGDCLQTLRDMPDGIANTCVTSPPYFGLRSYLPADHPDKPLEIGLEQTPEQFIAALVAVFREVRRVLADDGTLWLNIGDSYARPLAKGGSGPGGKNREWYGENYGDAGGSGVPGGCKPKDLIGIPWMLAFALRADGWYLRQDIIWHKPNPMPESVTDRCTKSHEYIFLLSKSERYYYDQGAIKEPVTQSTIARLSQDIEQQVGSARVPGKTNGNMKAVRSKRDSFKRKNSKRSEVIPGQSAGTHRPDREESAWDLETRNKRSVWTVATKPYSGAHFATFPHELIEPCILAGAPAGGVVLDPFFGSGTTGEVAQNLGRQWIGCELNEANKPLQDERLSQMGLELMEAA